MNEESVASVCNALVERGAERVRIQRTPKLSLREKFRLQETGVRFGDLPPTPVVKPTSAAVIQAREALLAKAEAKKLPPPPPTAEQLARIESRRKKASVASKSRYVISAKQLAARLEGSK
jgi:beta-phosphoglucomutase-like phosphatase (HAD superfamily)